MKVNVCPNCHAVSYGKNGWRYINKYNRAKLCVVCNHGIVTYKDGIISDRKIIELEKEHEIWMEGHSA